jgi:hypothetical protein
LWHCAYRAPTDAKEPPRRNDRNDQITFPFPVAQSQKLT